MERLYQIISRHFSQREIANLAADLGIYVPSNVDPNSMARELFSGARRNLRLDALFNEIQRRKAALKLDLGPNLYELIAGTFNEAEAAELTRNLGLDTLNGGLDANGLIGWNNDDFFKNKKAQTIQETALKQGQYETLLTEMKKIRPSLDLTVFQQSVLGQLTPQGTEDPSKPARKPSINTADVPPQTVQYIINVFGDNILGDKVGGDKVGGDVYKDINASDVSGSSISFGRESEASTQVKDVEGDVIIGGQGNAPDREALLRLIELINQDLEAIKTDLQERDAREAAEDLQQVKEEIQAEKPDGSWITRKLNDVVEIVEAAGVATAAASQLGPHVQQAIQIVQSLFSG